MYLLCLNYHERSKASSSRLACEHNIKGEPRSREKLAESRGKCI